MCLPAGATAAPSATRSHAGDCDNLHGELHHSAPADPNGIAFCGRQHRGQPGSADGYYNTGTLVQLTANAGTGYVFTGWSGDLTGSANPQSVAMSAPRSVTANFTGLRFFHRPDHRKRTGIGLDRESTGIDFCQLPWVAASNTAGSPSLRDQRHGQRDRELLGDGQYGHKPEVGNAYYRGQRFNSDTGRHELHL